MVPEKLRSRVLYMAHESLMSAHHSVKKTQEKISVVFYWPSMLNDVKRHVSNCDLCSGGLDRRELTETPLGHLPVVEDAAVVENHELAAVATVVVDDDKVREEFKRNNRNNCQLKGSYRDYFVRCEEIDGRKVECWCNDGLDHVLVQPKFIQPHQYTGKYKWYAITGTVRRKYLTAKMTFCGKRHYYEEEVLVVPGLKREFIYSSEILQRVQKAERSACKNKHETEIIKRRIPCGNRVRRNESNDGKEVLNKNKTPNCKGGLQRRFQQCRRSENPNWRKKEIDDQTYMKDVDGERVNKNEYSHGTRNRKPYNVTLY